MMSKVTVYRFQMYDVHSDQMQTSRRWATLEAIEEVHGQPLIHTAIEIDASHVGDEIEGFTACGFNPSSQISVGFQTQVTGGN